jgi:hypothetical protein
MEVTATNSVPNEQILINGVDVISFIKDQSIVNEAIVKEMFKNKSETEYKIDELDLICQDNFGSIKAVDGEVQILTNTVNYVCDDITNMKHISDEQYFELKELKSTFEEKIKLTNTDIDKFIDNISDKMIISDAEIQENGIEILTLNLTIKNLTTHLAKIQQKHASDVKELTLQIEKNKKEHNVEVDVLNNTVKNLSLKLDNMINICNNHVNILPKVVPTVTPVLTADTIQLKKEVFEESWRKNKINDKTDLILNLNNNQFKKYEDNLRKTRGCTQNIILHDIHVSENSMVCEVIGTTGNTYFVELVGRPKCTCLDFTVRNTSLPPKDVKLSLLTSFDGKMSEFGNIRCKHIYYVLEKILNVKNSEKNTYSFNELIKAEKNTYSFNELTKAENYKKIV